MKPYVASFYIPSPVQGTNRQTVTVPAGFKITRVIASVPADSTVDVLDSGNSVFGSRPLPGGVFGTANKKVDLPCPKLTTNSTLELVVECATAPSSPISVALIGYTD